MCSTDEDQEEGGSDTIQPPMQIVCDMDTDGGGWVVIMRRKKSVFAQVNFFRPWDTYYENEFVCGCANTLKGGWWYAACFPTGAHLTGPHSDASQWNRLLWYL